MTRLIAAIIAALFLAAPLAANAQIAPSYAAGPAQDGDANIHGRILTFDGAYSSRFAMKRATSTTSSCIKERSSIQPG